ncbi:hypothetical protein M0R45_011184 [Rubus argutus]|uniref:Uncharacterized protein n=1 Tax=Rubus argutus TaxID=59490 RepID=A0AAW1YAY0_RUBAR
MEGEPNDVVPCSSTAVAAIVSVGTTAAIWSLCSAPSEARNLGLTGIDRAGFVASSVTRCSFQYGLIGGILCASECGLQRYRRKDDWVNALISGAITGGAIAALSRSWKQVIPMVCLASAFRVSADYARRI